VADEVSLLLREQPFTVRRLVARSRRLAAGLPTVWQAFQRGEVDAEQVRVIDRVARRVTETHTLAAIDDQVVEAAQTRCPKQLSCWLLRLVVRLEPLAFEQRHRRALAERRVTVVQGVDGMGYVTGEVSAADAAAIDAALAAAARSLGRTILAASNNADPTCLPICCSDGWDLPNRSMQIRWTRTGWRSRTSTRTRANSWARGGSSLTATGKQSASRSMCRRRLLERWKRLS
jgi:hypothetical protein